jgi:cytochrome P450
MRMQRFPLLIGLFSPGRFFASFEMKSVIALLVRRYDFKLANADVPTTWVWRTFILPRKDTVLLMRERAVR